jgi:lipid A 4'-phosphatase
MRVPILFCALAAMFAALFLLAPNLDLATAGLFYQPRERFFLAAWWPVRFVEEVIPWTTRLIGVIAIFGAGWLIFTGRPFWRLDRKALIFIVAATALGPGLLVNTVLKDHWGRARPSQVVEFGGAHHFTPAPLPADQCERNCAFVSGHAALGFSLVSFAFLLPPGRKRIAGVAVALGFGSVVGLARMASGGHFLSDVVFAGLIAVAVSWLLYRWIVVCDVFASVAAIRFYGWLGARLKVSEVGGETLTPRQIWAWLAFVVAIAAVGIGWLDRPIAYFFFHTEVIAWHPFFHGVERFGFGWPYLVILGPLFAILRWGGDAPGLRAWAEPMRRAAWIPAFLFAAVAVSGLAVDILKVLFGRTRPKLWFANGSYDFTWLGLRADHWSFPSGHAATAAALMAGLWCLWPRPLPVYIALAALVALSRLVTGAHYLSDTVVGAFIGVVAARAIAVWLARAHVGSLFGRRTAIAPVLPQT